MSAPDRSATAFHHLDAFVDYRRLAGLALSPDGSRLVTSVSTRNEKHTAYVSAVWEIDPTGKQRAHRLTRSAEGEKNPAFTESGDLLFLSGRPTGETSDGQEVEGKALWQLPAVGGEARVVLSRPGGITTVASAASADVTLIKAPLLPGADDEDAHGALHATRSEEGVDAILHQGYPVRFWDHDLGPAQPHLFTLTAEDQLHHISDDIGVSLWEQDAQISPDGRFVLTTGVVAEAGAEQRTVLVHIDLDSGESTRLIDEPNLDVISALISPNSSQAIVSMSPKSTPESAPQPTLWLLDLTSGSRTALAQEWDRWGTPVAWLPDGSAVLVLADEAGRGPIFSVNTDTGTVSRLTSDNSTYSAVVVPASGESTVAYAMRSSPAFPAEVVRIDVSTGESTRLLGPVPRPELPGSLRDVETTTQDGTRVRGWLAMPEAGGDPAPLLVFIHGGPLASHNAWTWRWNPWIFTAQGYAVLLPDPALSTGYGQQFIERGWGSWGDKPYTDLIALTDEVISGDDIDADRTAALGGSFGGYMANWIAGHTDRFDAIVTHASLWALDSFGPTTDASFYWQREMTEQMALDNSPHRFVEHIVTPMLVIHGDKDYRVPIGEGLRLWYDLLSKSGSPAADDGSSVHRFLYFPQENHWVLKPQHSRIWYEVVMAFVGEHVLGDPATDPPAALGLTAPREQSAGKEAGLWL